MKFGSHCSGVTWAASVVGGDQSLPRFTAHKSRDWKAWRRGGILRSYAFFLRRTITGSRLAARSGRASLDALHPDAHSAATATGGGDRGCLPCARRWTPADRWACVLVDGLPRLQPSPHCREITGATGGHAPRDAWWHSSRRCSHTSGAACRFAAR